MWYHPPSGSCSDYRPPSIYFRINLPPKDFADIIANIRNGLLPSSVRIGLRQSSYLTHSSLPDGNPVIWNNDTNPPKCLIEIEEITFDYDLLEPMHDPETGTLIVPQHRPPFDVVKAQRQELKTQLSAIRQDISAIRIVLYAIAVAVVIFTAQSLFRH
jgi:hypothetical protein